MNILAIAAAVAALAASSAAFAQQPVPAAPAAPVEAGRGNATLMLSYTGVEAREGAIMVALFDSEAAFNGGAPVRVAAIPASGETVSTQFEGLAPGRYAIKSFHDIDGDGQMSVNPFGIPTEPFAFSNSARGNMGPPSWADSVFDINGATAHSISLR